MAKVVIRSGNDWLEVSVDGKKVIDGHSASPDEWAGLLTRLGNEVDYDDDGNFCAYCTKWTKKVKRVNGWDEVCIPCYERNKDEK